MRVFLFTTLKTTLIYKKQLKNATNWQCCDSAFYVKWMFRGCSFLFRKILSYFFSPLKAIYHKYNEKSVLIIPRYLSITISLVINRKKPIIEKGIAFLIAQFLLINFIRIFKILSFLTTHQIWFLNHKKIHQKVYRQTLNR